MELTDLIPEQPEFTLSSTGKTYVLRIPNLEDRMLMVQAAGGEAQVKTIFTELRWDVICKIVYRLLIDKSDFLATKESVINDEGVQETKLIPGPQLLMRAVRSNEDSVRLLGAFTSAITASEPLVRQYVKDEVKKNMELLKLTSTTGERSSMPSPQSTDTPQPSSEPLPSAS